MNLQSFLKCVAGDLRVFEIKPTHADGLILDLVTQSPVILDTVLVVVHNWSVLLLIGFVQNDLHRLKNILFHPLAIAHSCLDAALSLKWLANTVLILLFQLLQHPSLVLINDLVKVSIILLYFRFLLLTNFLRIAEVGINNVLLFP
jgi:hypothetical protein